MSTQDFMNINKTLHTQANTKCILSKRARRTIVDIATMENYIKIKIKRKTCSFVPLKNNIINNKKLIHTTRI